MKNLVSIIIVNFHSLSYLEKCLKTIKLYEKYSFYEIIVINNSIEENIYSVLEIDDKIKIIYNNENKGFAHANNIGISEAKGEFILLLNPDTLFLAPTLEKIVNQYYGLGKKKVGFCTVKTLNSDGSNQKACFYLDTMIWLVVKKYLSFLYKILRKKYTVNDESYSCDVVFGHFMFFNKSVLDYFPFHILHEDFFMYFEDFLWCHHVRKHGFLNYYFSTPKIIHFGGASFDSKIKRSEFYNKSATDFFNFVITERKRKFLNFIKVELMW